MKFLTKKIAVVVMLLLLAPVLLRLISYLPQLIKNKRYESEFYELVQEAKKKRSTLDLSNIDPENWDSLVFWGPYQDICNLNINGHKKGSSHCEVSQDDGECYLLLLKQGELAGKIKINLKTINWTTTHISGESKVGQRTPKKLARYKFLTYGDWPRIERIRENL